MAWSPPLWFLGLSKVISEPRRTCSACSPGAGLRCDRRHGRRRGAALRDWLSPTGAPRARNAGRSTGGRARRAEEAHRQATRPSAVGRAPGCGRGPRVRADQLRAEQASPAPLRHLHRPRLRHRRRRTAARRSARARWRCVSVAFDPFRRARHHVSRRRRRPRAVRNPDRAVRELGISPDRAIVDAIPRRRRASRAAPRSPSRRRSRSSCLRMPCSGVPRSPPRMPLTS